MLTSKTVTADRGGIAAGRNVIGYTAGQVENLIAVATSPLWKRTDEQQTQIRELEYQLGANEKQVLTFLRIIGEAQVAREHIGEKLVEIAERYKQLLTQVVPAPGDYPEIARLKEEAKAELDAGKLEQADALLEKVLLAQDRAVEQQWFTFEKQQLEAAATSAQRGNIALTRLHYREGAEHFAAAAKRVPLEHKEQALAYLDEEANALYDQGVEFGDNDALIDAIDRYRALLNWRTREQVPLDWAMTQNRLGSVLGVLGERERGTARLEEAVDVFRAALQEYTHERAPLDWAMTQNNLGRTLQVLGGRESGTTRLEDAVDAFRAALQEYTLTRESLPTLKMVTASLFCVCWDRDGQVSLDWAAAQNNLGNTLRMLGERESGTTRLKEAVDAFRAALQERTRERVPLDWAMTQNNLGGALSRLGERESGTTRLEEAVDAFRAALQEQTHERVPLDWAMTQNNLGGALLRLGEREGGTTRLEEAIDAFRAALQERTRERVPLDWAMTQNNLGVTLFRLGRQEDGTARLEEAVDAFRAALQEYTHERAPLDWAMTQNNLGSALSMLGEREGSTAQLEQAVDAFRAALQERTRERAPLQWAGTQNNLGIVLETLGERENNTKRLDDAVNAYEGALNVYETSQAAYYVSILCNNVERVKIILAQQQAPS